MKETLKLGDIVWLYNDITDKWEEFIIMSEEDLEMVLSEYKWRKNYDNTEKVEN